jgi:HEAT repeat protein
MVRSKATWILGEIRDTGAVQPLIETLKDGAWTVRLEAVKALGKMRDARAIDPLIETLKDKNTNVSECASETLTDIGSPGVARLIFALKDEDIRIRSTAATALGKAGDVRAVVPLIEAMKDNSWLVRYEAVKALGKIRDTRALEPLRDAVNDRDSSVRAIAAAVLQDFQGR